MMNYVDGFKDRYKVAPVLVPHGQELQPETHAVALGSMLLKNWNLTQAVIYRKILNWAVPSVMTYLQDSVSTINVLTAFRYVMGERCQCSSIRA